jgi:hypothetical protein
MEKNEKYFMWFDSSDHMPYYGPHYFGDEYFIKKKLYHSLSDLKKISISNSIKKRLAGARIGTEIKIHYLHSSGDLYLRRISESETKILDKVHEYNIKHQKLNNEILKLEKKKNSLISEIWKN